MLTFSLSFALVLALVACAPTYAQQSENATTLVHAGQGNATDIVFTFIPHNSEINVGESITWDNPNFYAEPHSVTFLKEKKFFADFAMPLALLILLNFYQ